MSRTFYHAKKKEDFSAFDIFQHVPEKNREIKIQNSEEENLEELTKILLGAQRQALFLSGNLSFINLREKKKELFEVFERLAKRKIAMKVLCRVDFAGKENVERVLSLNSRHGQSIVEIRHDIHPLRGFIVDGRVIRLKEVKEPTGKINELNKRKFIFYNISDKSWAEWLSRIFWKKFSNSMDASNRLEHLKQIKW